DNYAYLYDANGIQNKYVILLGRDSRNLDSFYSVPVTNYSQNILSHQYNPASNQVADVLQVGDKYNVYFRELQMPGVNAEPKTLQPTILATTELTRRIKPTYTQTADGSIYSPPPPAEPILKSGNVFQSEFPDTPADTTSAEVKVVMDEVVDTTPVAQIELDVPDTANVNDSILVRVDSTYIKMKPQPYRLSFKTDFFSVRLDNSVLFNRYQSVDQSSGRYANPPLGGMLTVSLDDLMENHRFTGGIRLPINFSGMTWFLQYENFKKRLDKSVLFLRSTNVSNEEVPVRIDSVTTRMFPLLLKRATNLLQGSVSYPLDRVRSVKFHLGLRQDQLTVKAQDDIGLFVEPSTPKLYWASGRLEYVFDNASKPLINIFNGFRYKFFAEYLYKLNDGNGGFYNLGLDFRHYQKIFKNFILANRLAGAHSGGNQKILYFLGGVDNWLMPQYSSYVPVRPTENYAFQALATNLRGYLQNARNGNTYAVLNSELRLPIFTTFLKRPVQSTVLRNMQAVAFMDAGSAWNGLLPNADALKNNVFLANQNVALSLDDQTGGLGLGYGLGLRTTLFGYFVRTDVAWNIEGNPKPIIYVSFGTDF
ncbi:MAG: hypothetical protein K0R82_1097, partial [Flavipsychrobacter sp.]|nr:hypothetical protein [Flavipsychrobacter sp.]